LGGGEKEEEKEKAEFLGITGEPPTFPTVAPFQGGEGKEGERKGDGRGGKKSGLIL